MPYLFIERSKASLENLHYRKNQVGLMEFPSLEKFIEWYNAQPKICSYCGIDEKECQEIVMTGRLKSNRFPQDGIIGRGTARGVWLEVDRVNPREKYNVGNCVLCCYFCNNDKSDIFSGIEYKDFYQNRAVFLRKLLAENQKKE